MSWTTRFEPAARRGVLTADGPIDLGGSVEALLGLAADPALGPGWGILVDLTAATYTPTLADAVKLGALQQHAGALDSRRIGFLTGNPTLHAVAGLLAGMATTKGILAKAFSDSVAAHQWLAEAPDRPTF